MSGLRQHAVKHSDEKIECEECKSFCTRYYLIKHKLIHSDVRVKHFQCQVCGKAFEHKESLARHIVLHGPRKLFKCEMCDKSFNWRWNLKAHLQIHNRTIEIHKCEKCGQILTSKGSYEKHLLIHMQKTHIPVLNATSNISWNADGKGMQEYTAL